jgi:hypothetical protein
MPTMCFIIRHSEIANLQSPVALASSELGAEVEFGELALGHRSQAVPVKADVFLSGIQVLRDELAGCVQEAAVLVRVGDGVLATLAAEGRRRPHLLEVILLLRVLAVLRPLNVLPAESLAVAAAPRDCRLRNAECRLAVHSAVAV